MRNVGSAILGGAPNSARNLNNLHGSNNGSDHVVDNVNMGNKYLQNGNARDGPREYQPSTGAGGMGGRPPKYVKGAYYGIDVAPMDDGRLGSRLSPRNQQAAAAQQQHSYAERQSPIGSR